MKGDAKNPARAPIAYRRQAAPDGALRLDANEGPPPRFTAVDGTIGPQALRRYPDTAALEADLADLFGVAPDRVLTTAGGDDAIDRMCRRFLRGGRELVLTVPTFEMFARHAHLAGGRVSGIEWWQGPYPRRRVQAALGPALGFVAVVSPNNPTGAVVTADDLRALRTAAGAAPLLLDAAYAEFADEDLTAAALELPRTVVLRTLSKAWGLAGLRVGCLLGPPDLLAELRAWGQPYAVAGPSIAIARASLAAGEAGVRANVRDVGEERAVLTRRLATRGARPLPSQGNFVLCRPPDAAFLGSALSALGVSVRTWPDDPLLDRYVRITCPGDAASFARLGQALDTVLAPQALLLDMDGVLADEGPSYRETIVAVAAGYGCAVTRREIAAAKAAGGANNDWGLTRRLLAAHGVDVSPGEVRTRFQAVYLGEGGRPGLCERETLIPPPSLLSDLAERLPLAVVTGRPREDAERFLERFGLSDLFTTVVALEDATAKPDPAPVREALRRLGATRAWMVGDTPDDIAAARAAGVVPLGIRPPDPADDTGAALAAVGSAIVIDDLIRLKEMLP